MFTLSTDETSQTIQERFVYVGADGMREPLKHGCRGQGMFEQT
jgi:hypothetical protein